MRILFFVMIFIGFVYKGHTQEQTLTLKSKHKKIMSLIPKDWTIVSIDKDGDLNNDGINDLAFVIKKVDSNNILTNNSVGIDSLDINPKILGIYFKNSKGCFEKKLQHNTFVFVNKDPTMEEPFQELSLTNEGLNIEFQSFYNAGSWFVNNESYTFKYIDKAFKLIKYKKSSLHRASMDFEEEMTDFIKGITLVIKETYKEDDDQKENPITKLDRINFEPKELKLLKHIEIPFMFYDFDLK